MTTPQIYIASLEAYNAGKLIGEWVDADCQSTIEDAIESLPGEEWAIHDFEDMPNLGENPSLDLVVGIAECVNGHGLDIVNAWVGLVGLHWLSGMDAHDIVSALDDTLYGTYESVEDFGYEQAGALGLPQTPEVEWYFDFEAYGRDCLDSHSYSDLGNGRIAVFFN